MSNCLLFLVVGDDIKGIIGGDAEDCVRLVSSLSTVGLAKDVRF